MYGGENMANRWRNLYVKGRLLMFGVRAKEHHLSYQPLEALTDDPDFVKKAIAYSKEEKLKQEEIKRLKDEEESNKTRELLKEKWDKKQADKQNNHNPPCSRGRRKAGLFAGRPAEQGGSLPAAPVRRTVRHAGRGDLSEISGAGQHRGGAAGLYARPDAG